MSEEKQGNAVYWGKIIGNASLRIDIDLGEVKNVTKEVFTNESDNYKQKLVYNLLEAVKIKDQNRFFYILLKTINKPKEDFKDLWGMLEKNYDIMPEETFVNFAYAIIIGIMSTYKGGE